MGIKLSHLRRIDNELIKRQWVDICSHIVRLQACEGIDCDTCPFSLSNKAVRSMQKKLDKLEEYTRGNSPTD